MKKYLHLWLFSATIATTALLLLWSASLNVVAASSQLKLYITPGGATLRPGETVTTQVRLNKTTSNKVDYVNAEMRFTQSTLEIISVSKNGSRFANNNGPTVSYNNSSGVLSIKGSGSTLPTPADVLVATITFRAKSVGSGTVNFASTSQAGDILGGDKVKNYLDETAGSSLMIYQPPQPAPPAPAPPAPVQVPIVETPETPQTQTNEQANDASLAPDNGLEDGDNIQTGAGGTFRGDDTGTPNSSNTSPVFWPLVALSGIIAVGSAVGYYFFVTKKSHRRLESIDQIKTSQEPVVGDKETDKVQMIDDEQGAIESDYDIAADDSQAETVDPSVSDTNLDPSDTEVIVAEPVEELQSLPDNPEVVHQSPPTLATPAVARPEGPQVTERSVAPTAEEVQQPNANASKPATIGNSKQLEDPSNIPDMFEVGEARLRSEGF